MKIISNRILASRIAAFIAGSIFTVSFFEFADVGASDVISLQSPNSSITAVSTYSSNSIPVVYTYSESYISNKNDVSKLEANTITVYESDYSNTTEVIDVSEFSYDGLSYWNSCNLLNVRTEPSIESDVLCQIEYGTSVVRVSYGNSWSFIRCEDGTEGFVMSSFLSDEELEIITSTPTPIPVVVTVEETTEEEVDNLIEETAETESTEQDYSITEYSVTMYASCALNVRTGPGIDYSLDRVLAQGDELAIVGYTDNGWYQLSDGCFVKSDLCSETIPETITDESTSTDSSSDFYTYCVQFVGTPYVYAGSSTSGFDCSGFVDYVFANYYGISLPHNAAEIAELGTAVSSENVQCGDVLCHDYNGDGYIEHVSIYIGNSTCIHASNTRSGVVTTEWPMGSVVTIRRFI